MNAKKQAGNAPNAQNKSIGDYGSEGLGFESLRARFTLKKIRLQLSVRLGAFRCSKEKEAKASQARRTLLAVASRPIFVSLRWLYYCNIGDLNSG